MIAFGVVKGVEVLGGEVIGLREEEVGENGEGVGGVVGGIGEFGEESESNGEAPPALSFLGVSGSVSSKS